MINICSVFGKFIYNYVHNILFSSRVRIYKSLLLKLGYILTRVVDCILNLVGAVKSVATAF